MQKKWGILMLLCLAIIALFIFLDEDGLSRIREKTSALDSYAGIEQMPTERVRDLSGHGKRKISRKLSEEEKVKLINALRIRLLQSEKDRMYVRHHFVKEGKTKIFFRVRPLENHERATFEEEILNLEDSGIGEGKIGALKEEFGFYDPTKEYRFLMTYDPTSEEMRAVHSFSNGEGRETSKILKTTLSKIKDDPEAWRFSHMIDLVPEFQDGE